MRINVKLIVQKPISLQVNQNYFLASTIYNTLSCRPEYSEFLHDQGYVHEPSQRAFKLFVFSPLMCGSRRLQGDTMILGPGQINWIISSPMEEFLLALAEGLLSNPVLSIRDAELPIEAVETLPELEYTTAMRFKCLSPIVATSTVDGSNYAKYLTNEDPDFSEKIRQNAIRKHELLHGCPPKDNSLKLTFDQNYIDRKGRVTKLIRIRNTDIRGVLCPFKLEGSVELMKLIYSVGVGEKNSMGFGCVELSESRTKILP